MSRLNLRAESSLDGDQDGVRSQAAHVPPATGPATEHGAPQRAARRRGATPRLRIRTDDGFHPFRVY